MATQCKQLLSEIDVREEEIRNAFYKDVYLSDKHCHAAKSLVDLTIQ